MPQRGRAEIQSAVGHAFQRLHAPAGEAPYVLNLLGALDPAVERDLIAPLSPEAVRVRTFEALRHLFLAASLSEPLVIAVEDVHWADDTSERSSPRSRQGSPPRRCCCYDLPAREPAQLAGAVARDSDRPSSPWARRLAGGRALGPR